jgi:ParB-like chromosome segregation protein Spo0J
VTDLPDESNALAVVYRDPKGLRVNPRNARTHSAGQLAQLRDSFVQFGFTNPLLIDAADGIIAGHGRHLAALIEPALPFVPTITLRGLTDEQKRAYMVADNKIALNSGWNVELLAAELDSLRGVGIDGLRLGFSSGELAGMLGTPNLPPRRNVDDADKHLLVVECKDEHSLQTLYEEMSGRGFHVKLMS